MHYNVLFKDGTMAHSSQKWVRWSLEEADSVVIRERSHEELLRYHEELREECRAWTRRWIEACLFEKPE